MMKKKLFVFAASFLVAGVAMLSLPTRVLAATDQVVLSATSTGAISTNTATASLKGKVEKIRIVCPAGATSSVAIVSSEGDVLFSNATVTADTTIYPRVATHSTAGAALTWLTTGDGSTNAAANTIYSPMSICGTLTMTSVRTDTNLTTLSVYINYDK